MTTKPNPFLAGMLATGREAFTTDDDRREYEAGYMAIPDITSAFTEMDATVFRDTDEARKKIARLMAEIETTWSSIKAALASDVTP